MTMHPCLAMLLLLLFAASCKKGENSVNEEVAVCGNTQSQFYSAFCIDLDKDQVKDFAIVYNYVPLQEASKTYRIVPLHPQAAVHVENAVAYTCTDTVHFQMFSYYNSYSCSAGSPDAQPEVFTATPNLEEATLASTVFNAAAGDTVLIHSWFKRNDMPSPGAHFIEKEKGFFKDADEGFLLLRTGGTRYGLMIKNSPAPLQIIKQKKID